ncbi:hypothetical protein NPIL_502881 [Nephila pilipes]|uniref:Uncharacterized protein n=1 Tax=Nephila pilipes TaxID=299642 RepID=A0A8X6PZ68_NEPPI|nr:hypothetical protein NPIL_502881 [Nephila pilipes]
MLRKRQTSVGGMTFHLVGKRSRRDFSLSRENVQKGTARYCFLAKRMVFHKVLTWTFHNKRSIFMSLVHVQSRYEDYWSPICAYHNDSPPHLHESGIITETRPSTS